MQVVLNILWSKTLRDTINGENMCINDEKFVAELEGGQKSEREVFEEFISKKEISTEEMDEMFLSE